MDRASAGAGGRVTLWADRARKGYGVETYEYAVIVMGRHVPFLASDGEPRYVEIDALEEALNRRGAQGWDVAASIQTTEAVDGRLVDVGALILRKAHH